MASKLTECTTQMTSNHKSNLNHTTTNFYRKNRSDLNDNNLHTALAHWTPKFPTKFRVPSLRHQSTINVQYQMFRENKLFDATMASTKHRKKAHQFDLRHNKIQLKKKNKSKHTMKQTNQTEPTKQNNKTNSFSPLNFFRQERFT